MKNKKSLRGRTHRRRCQEGFGGRPVRPTSTPGQMERSLDVEFNAVEISPATMEACTDLIRGVIFSKDPCESLHLKRAFSAWMKELTEKRSARIFALEQKAAKKKAEEDAKAEAELQKNFKAGEKRKRQKELIFKRAFDEKPKPVYIRGKRAMRESWGI